MALDAPQRVFDVDAKKYSLLGLGVFLTDRIVCTIINVTSRYEMVFAGIDAYSRITVIFNWMMPLLILQKIERRGQDSVGLKVRSDRWLIYTALAFVGFVLPSFFLGFDLEFDIPHLSQHVSIKVMMTGDITGLRA